MLLCRSHPTRFAPRLLVAFVAASAGAESGARPSCDGLDPLLAGSEFVLVESPVAGARLEPGASVAGCARTRDGALAWRLEGKDGRKLGEGTAPAGGKGAESVAHAFSFPIAFELAAAEGGTLLLFASGKAAGTPAAALPLVVVPAAPPPLFARYAGKLADGIAAELMLYGELEREPRTFVLVESRTATSPGDARHERRGSWDFGVGAAESSSAIVVTLRFADDAIRGFVLDGRDLLPLDPTGKRHPTANDRLVRQP